MTEEALEARRAYYRKRASEHREQNREYQRNWHKAHPERQKIYTERFWERKAAEYKAAAEIQLETPEQM